MITNFEIINQPYSGEFREKIFDPFSIGLTQDWTWIKFTEDMGSHWCGQFRGFPIVVLGLKKNKRIAILTTSAFYLLDASSGELIQSHINEEEWRSLAISPNDDIIVANDFEFARYDLSKLMFLPIDPPSSIGEVEFKGWTHEYLIFDYSEYWSEGIKQMKLDTVNWTFSPYPTN